MLQATRLLTGVLGMAPARDRDRCERALQDWKLAADAAPGSISDGLAASVGRQVLPLLADAGPRAPSPRPPRPWRLSSCAARRRWSSSPRRRPAEPSPRRAAWSLLLATADDAGAGRPLAIQRLAAHPGRAYAAPRSAPCSPVPALTRFEQQPGLVLDAALARLAVEEDAAARAALIQLLGRLPSAEHLGRLTSDPRWLPCGILSAFLRPPSRPASAGSLARFACAPHGAEWVAPEARGRPPSDSSRRCRQGRPRRSSPRITCARSSGPRAAADTQARCLTPALQARPARRARAVGPSEWLASLPGNHLRALLLGAGLTDATSARPDPDGALAASVPRHASAAAAAATRPSRAWPRSSAIASVPRSGGAPWTGGRCTGRAGGASGAIAGTADLGPARGAQRVAAHLPDAAPGSGRDGVPPAGAHRGGRGLGRPPRRGRLSDLEHWATFARD